LRHSARRLAPEIVPNAGLFLAILGDMTSIVISTIVYFIAAYFIKRHLVEMGIPKGMTRGTVIFVLAAAVAYGAAYVVDLVVS
jgi:hypothetical protein